MYMTLWLHSCVDWYMNMLMCEWMLSAVLCVWAYLRQWICWHLSLTTFECPVIWSECYLCVNECVCMFMHVNRLMWMCSFAWMWECVPICVWMHECVFGNNCEPIGVCSHASVKECVIFMFVRGYQYVHVCEWVQMYVSMSLCNWLSLWVYVIVSGNVLVCCCVLLSLHACTFEYHHLCECVNLTCEWSVSVWVWAHVSMNIQVCPCVKMLMCQWMWIHESLCVWRYQHVHV